MLKFTATIQRFDRKGEKTGWQYIEVSAAQARKLNNSKASFRVKGSIDSLAIQKTALLPMGEGHFILPLNSTIRKAIGKEHGDKVTVTFELDQRISPHLIACLKEDPGAMKFFKALPPSHQGYYSKWIESAKTARTKTNRIVMAINGFAKKQGYGEMMREDKGRFD